MPCHQLIAMDDVKVNAGMQGDFDLPHDEFSLSMTAEGMEVARAAGGGKADRMLARLRMPVMDGFHFLSYLAGHHFDLSIVLGSAAPSDSSQHYLLASKPPSRFSHPVGHEPKRLPGLALPSGLPRAPRNGVTLLDFLRFCVEERQTRVLEVSAGGQTAVFHLTFGRLFHARCGEREGLSVFFEVLGWDAPSLRILPTLPGLYTSITAEMDRLLLQAEEAQERRTATPPPQGRSGEARHDPRASAPEPVLPMIQRAALWASRWSLRRWWEASSFRGRRERDRRLVNVLSNGQ